MNTPFTEELTAVARDHRESLVRVATRITRDEETAREAVQEALLSALGQWNEFKREASVKSFLFKIVINRSIDIYRRQKRWVDLLPFFQSEVSLVTDDSNDLASQVRTIANRLPDKLRLPLMLAVYEELPYKEIADILGIPLNTVKSRVFKAREKIRDIALKQELLS